MAQLDHLSRFEKFARKLIEGSLDRFFDDHPMSNQIGNELAKAIERSSNDGAAANRYAVVIDAQTYAEMEGNLEAMSHQFEELVNRLAEEIGVVFAAPVRVEFEKDTSYTSGEITVQAKYDQSFDNPTLAKPVYQNRVAMEAIKAVDAFLIVNGKRHIALDKPIISLGRHLGNDIVLDESSVSRQHAQIRWRYGRFVLHDLGSRSGSLVNGIRINECVLQAGDVIRLGNAAIIYGEELLENEKPFPRSLSSDGATRELFRDERE